jgi:hypothetical protein
MEEQQEKLLCASAALLERAYTLAHEGLSPVTAPTAEMFVTTYHEVRSKLRGTAPQHLCCYCSRMSAVVSNVAPKVGAAGRHLVITSWKCMRAQVAKKLLNSFPLHPLTVSLEKVCSATAAQPPAGSAHVLQPAFAAGQRPATRRWTGSAPRCCGARPRASPPSWSPCTACCR